MNVNDPQPTGSGRPEGELGAMAYLDDLVRGGHALDAALKLAIAAYPDDAADLGDYALMIPIRALSEETPAELNEMIAARSMIVAQRMRSAAEGRPLPGILSRFDEIRKEPKRAAASLRLGWSALVKLDRRLIEAASVPRRLAERLAEALETDASSVLAYLSGGAQLSPAAEYKASRTPRARRKESFQAALRSAVAAGEMTADDEAFWVSGEAGSAP